MKERIGGDLIERRKAIFSDCEQYRYLIEIIWDDSKPLCQFIGLNPSTADEMKDDPTMRRCKDFAKRWGCGGLLMTNVFAIRATQPAEMMIHPAPNGGAVNYETILEAASRSEIIVAAWGKDGDYRQWGYHVQCLLANARHKVQCFKLTKNGQPYHPLYMAAKTPLIDLPPPPQLTRGKDL